MSLIFLSLPIYYIIWNSRWRYIFALGYRLLFYPNPPPPILFPHFRLLFLLLFAFPFSSVIKMPLHLNWMAYNCWLFAADGQYVVTISHDPTIKLWPSKGNGCLKTMNIDWNHSGDETLSSSILLSTYKWVLFAYFIVSDGNLGQLNMEKPCK